MKMRPLILSTLLGGSMLACAATATQAHARSGEIRLVPQTSWAISKIKSEQVGGDYCTMARRFSNNLVLTVARNANAETSLAVDFQRDMLKTTRAYTVILTSGGVSKAFDVTPVSTKAFVIRTGTQDELLKAVERSGVLDVNFRGKLFRFVISDMQNGDTQLGACVNSLIEPAGGATQVADTSPVAARTTIHAPYRHASAGTGDDQEYVSIEEGSAEVAVDEVELENMRRQVNRLNAENERLSSALSLARQEYEERMQDSGDGAVVNELRERLDLLERENKALRKSTGDDPELVAELEKKEQLIAALEEQIQGLEQSNKAMQASLEQARQSSGANTASIEAALAETRSELGSLKEEKAKLQAQNSELQAKLVSGRAQESESKRLESEISALQEENNVLQASLDKTREQLTQARANLLESSGDKELVRLLEGRLAEMTAQKSEMESRILSLEREVASAAELKANVAESKAGAQELKSALQEAQKDNARLKEELANLETANSGEVQALKRVHEVELAKLKERILELEEENKSLYASFEETRGAAKVNAADKERLSHLEDQVDFLETQLGQQKQANAKLREELELARQKIASAGQDNVTNAALVEELRSEVTALRTENADLKARLAKGVSAENDRLAEKLLRHESTITELRGIISDLRAKNLALQNTVDDLQRKYNNRINVSAADALLEMEMKELETKLEAAERANRRLNQELQTALSMETEQASVAGKNWDIEKATRRYNEAESEIRRLGALLEKEKTQCSAEVHALENKLFDPAVARKAQAEKLRALQENVARAKESKEMCESRIASFEDRLDKGTERMQSLESLQNSLRAREAEIASLSQENDELHSALAEAKAARENYEQKLASLESGNTQGASASQVAPMQDIEPTSGHIQARSANGVSSGSSVRRPGTVIEKEPRPTQNMRAARNVAEPQEQGGEVIAMPLASIQSETRAATPGPDYMSSAQMRQLLQLAGLQESADTLQKLDSAPGGKMMAFTWDAEGGIYGTAEQKSLGGPAQFETMVSEYLDMADSRCAGDFAAIPANDKSSVNGYNISSYEIACVSDDIDSSASILFFAKDGIFSTIAHETGTDNMAKAMDIRDRFIKTLAGSRTAMDFNASSAAQR